jgi:hypothetical protein
MATASADGSTPPAEVPQDGDGRDRQHELHQPSSQMVKAEPTSSATTRTIARATSTLGSFHAGDCPDAHRQRVGGARFPQATTTAAFAAEAWTTTKKSPVLGVCSAIVADPFAWPSESTSSGLYASPGPNTP